MPRLVLAANVLVCLVFLLAASRGAQAEEAMVLCGRVGDFKPATASNPGSMVLTAGQPITVTIPAGTGGEFSGYICVSYRIVNGVTTFAGLVPPGAPGFTPEAVTIVCGTLGPNTATSGPQAFPNFVELRNARGFAAIIGPDGIARVSMGTEFRPAFGTYVCVRTVARNAFFEFVRPGEPGYIPPAASGPAALPNTSTSR